MKNLIITTECVADIPDEFLDSHDISVIFYDIATDSGIFRDTAEIDARNLMEYMSDGVRKAQSIIPSVEDYIGFFTKNLKNNKEVFHIAISSGISGSFSNAMEAKNRLGENGNRITVIDSKHLSSGQGLLVIEAAKMAEMGLSSEDIKNKILEMIPRVSTSFITFNADYLYYNGKVDKGVKNLCHRLKLHPVLYMNPEGKLSVKKVYMGNYEKCSNKYIKKLLKNQKITREQLMFVTYAGCTHDKLDRVQGKIKEYTPIKEIHEVQASATVSCNCGPQTFGVLFVKNGGER